MGKLSNFFDLFKRNSLSENNNINDKSILNEHENVEFNLKDNDYDIAQIDNNENINASKEQSINNYTLNNTFRNESDFLKLFKYDSIADSSKTFNIETALNNNWDKVDTFAENVSQQMEQKADLVDGKVPNNQLPEISSSAEDITITDITGNFTATNVEGALTELFQSANDGKTAIRNAISGKGVTVSLGDTFTLLASKITAQMCKFGGTAVVTDVLSGKTFINNSGEILTGTMSNQGAKSASLNAGGSYTIPAGYHDGSGIVSANSLVSQTVGTATAENILNSYTAWVDGVKITGSMTNNGATLHSLTNQGGQYTIPSGYHNGSGKITANISNLMSENIKQGVNVGGIIGTFAGEGVKSVQLVKSGNFCLASSISIPNPVVKNNSLMIPMVAYGAWDNIPFHFALSDNGATIDVVRSGNYYYDAVFLIIEFSPGVIKSVQTGITNNVNWRSDNTSLATVNSVSTAKTIVICNSFMTASSRADRCGTCCLYMVNSTTVGLKALIYSDYNNYPIYYSVIEFN